MAFGARSKRATGSSVRGPETWDLTGARLWTVVAKSIYRLCETGNSNFRLPIWQFEIKLAIVF